MGQGRGQRWTEQKREDGREAVGKRQKKKERMSKDGRGNRQKSRVIDRDKEVGKREEERGKKVGDQSRDGETVGLIMKTSVTDKEIEVGEVRRNC